MAIGTVTKYDQFESIMAGESERQWEDATAGSCMFILVGNAYTPASTHTTTTNLTDVITAGDGAPINVTTPTLDDTTTAGTTYWDSLAADFGADVTVTAKYLVCIQPVTAATYSATTSKVLWYVDLDDTTTSTEVSSIGAAFKVNPSANGWIKST